MDDPKHILSWVEGFSKTAAERGVTDPVRVQELLKVAWYMESEDTNPAAFNEAYDHAIRMREVQAEKQAVSLSAVRNALLVGTGVAAGSVATSAGKSISRGIHDQVAMNDTRNLTEGMAREAAKPNLMGRNRGTPYSGFGL